MTCLSEAVWMRTRKRELLSESWSWVTIDSAEEQNLTIWPYMAIASNKAGRIGPERDWNQVSQYYSVGLLCWREGEWKRGTDKRKPKDAKILGEASLNWHKYRFIHATDIVLDRRNTLVLICGKYFKHILYLASTRNYLFMVDGPREVRLG